MFAMLLRPRTRSRMSDCSSREIADVVLGYMRECESRDLVGLLARMTKSNTPKSAPKFDIIMAYSSLAFEMAKIAPNMIIGYVRLKYAVHGLHNEEACVFGKRSYNKELISIAQTLKLGMRKYAVLKGDRNMVERILAQALRFRKRIHMYVLCFIMIT